MLRHQRLHANEKESARDLPVLIQYAFWPALEGIRAQMEYGRDARSGERLPPYAGAGRALLLSDPMSFVRPLRAVSRRSRCRGW